MFSLGYLTVEEDYLKRHAVDQMISAITSCRENPIFNLEIKNYETPGNKVKFLCEKSSSILLHQSSKKYVAIECTKFSKFLRRLIDDQDKFWIDIHQMLLKDDLWNSFITESVAVTKPEIVSLFLYSLLQEYVTHVIREDNTRRESGQTKTLDLTLTGEEEKVIYYVAGYVVFSLTNKYKMLKSSKN